MLPDEEACGLETMDEWVLIVGVVGRSFMGHCMLILYIGVTSSFVVVGVVTVFVATTLTTFKANSSKVSWTT